jgi:hypothetical protein
MLCFTVYTGKEIDPGPAREHIYIDSTSCKNMKDIKKKGHNVYMDNFYSSIGLFEYLTTEWYWGLWNSLCQQEGASNTCEGCQGCREVNCPDFGPFMIIRQ